VKGDLAVPVSGADHRLGPMGAELTIVEYGDFECPVCKQAAPVLKHLIRRFPQRVALVFRHYPLKAIHPHALRAAEAAECAGAQGRFWQMHELLFANQGRLSTRYLLMYAERLQLDLGRFRREMADRIHLQRIRQQIDGGSRSHLRSAPRLFVHGRIVDVSFGMRSIVEAVERSLDDSPAA
jgi:protein-disulfide isomerase